MFRTRTFYLVIIAIVTYSVLQVFDEAEKFVLQADYVKSAFKIMYDSGTSVFLLVIYSVFPIIFATNESIFRTDVTICSRGFSKKNLFLAKLITIVFATIIFFICHLLTTYISGLIMLGKNKIKSFDYYSGFIFAQLYISVVLNVIVLSISFIIKNIYLSITLSYASYFIDKLFIVIYNNITKDMKINYPKYVTIDNQTKFFLPQNLGLTNILELFGTNQYDFALFEIPLYLFVMTFYAIIFVFIALIRTHTDVD